MSLTKAEEVMDALITFKVGDRVIVDSYLEAKGLLRGTVIEIDIRARRADQLFVVIDTDDGIYHRYSDDLWHEE